MLVLGLASICFVEGQWVGNIVTLNRYDSMDGFCYPTTNSVSKNYSINCPNGETTVQNSCYITGGGTLACYDTVISCNFDSTLLTMANNIGHSIVYTNYTISPPSTTNISTSTCVWTATSSTCQCNWIVEWEVYVSPISTGSPEGSTGSPEGSFGLYYSSKELYTTSDDGNNLWIIFISIAILVCFIGFIIVVGGFYFVKKTLVVGNYESIND